MQKHHKPNDEVVLRATATILQWLQSAPGRAAIAETERQSSTSADWHNVKIGFAVGRYAQHISDSTIAQADINVLCKEIFGETVAEQVARKFAASGGKIKSEAKTVTARENGKLGGRPRKKLETDESIAGVFIE